ncbi:MAG TPA: hypothetical protein VFL59_03230, partial [Candidatus Nanopelagicales bacterium]|nr:hypothetical protein [Candidatus Nanopelagicales bacterium]
MGTHQARPLPATPPFPASATVAPSASYLSIPPSEPLPRLRSSATPLEAPSGSSGLVPVRGGPRTAAPLGASGGSVPTIVPMTAPPRV